MVFEAAKTVSGEIDKSKVKMPTMLSPPKAAAGGGKKAKRTLTNFPKRPSQLRDLRYEDPENPANKKEKVCRTNTRLIFPTRRQMARPTASILEAAAARRRKRKKIPMLLVLFLVPPRKRR